MVASLMGKSALMQRFSMTNSRFRSMIMSQTSSGQEAVAMAHGSSGIDADLSFIELEGAFIVPDDGQLLGKITTNSIDHNSIINSIGRYGSSISSTSMFNSIGKYGSDILRLSPFNDITSSPPRIFKGERFIACLTMNKMKKTRVDPRALVGWLKSQE
jgi:hypothetical protein